MTKYVVKETITVLFYVEADSPEAAIERAKERGPLECDEVDASVPSRFAAVLDMSEGEGQ